MIKAIALDDEPLALAILNQFCAQHPDVVLLGQFSNSNEAKHFLEQHKIDLLFLDIDMPQISGFEFYESLAYQPQLILATAYQQFALQGYDINATDYLLKPFTQKRFDQAIAKVTQLTTTPPSSDNKTIWVKVEAGNTKINANDILWIEALDNYVKIHLAEGKPMLVRMALKSIMDLLPSNEFVRIHRSYIVSIAHVQHLLTHEVVIANTKLPIGIVYKKDLHNRFHR